MTRLLLARNRDHGFSLIEVMIAVSVLGMIGLAFINGLQGNVLQSRKLAARSEDSVRLAAAVDVLKAAPFVSCAVDADPYLPLKTGVQWPDGVTFSVDELTAAGSWQACDTVKTAGAVQRLMLTTPAGSQDSLLRFANGVLLSTTPQAADPFAVSYAVAPPSACNAFRDSKSNKTCTVTLTASNGSGSNWHVTSIAFAGGTLNPIAPTPSVAQPQQIVFDAYLVDGGASCSKGTQLPLQIAVVDDGNQSTASVSPVVKC